MSDRILAAVMTTNQAEGAEGSPRLSASDLAKLDEHLQDSEDTAERYNLGVFGWLSATVAALQSGGLVTALSMVDRLYHPLWTAGIFFAGVSASMLAAFAFAWFVSDEAEQYEREIAAAKMAPGPGQFAAVQSIKEEQERFGPALASLLIFAIVSAACLLVGAARLVWTIDFNEPNNRRCLAIQRDMLSAHPRKPDGPALFQAFGCRPQGEGSVMVAPTELEIAAHRASAVTLDGSKTRSSQTRSTQ